MTPLYWPDRLELRTELPRNPQGKVLRAALSEQVSGAPARGRS
jgi:acyl-coenzyme A synthetase/AMP-(fatty) acid ligase